MDINYFGTFCGQGRLLFSAAGPGPYRDVSSIAGAGAMGILD
jgi:hypothetical protein